MPAYIAWENAFLSGTVSASAETVGLGAGQVQNAQGATSTAWQTPLGTTSAWLQVDGGAGAAWRVLSLHRTNLTTTATVRWRLSNDPAFGSAIYDSGVVSAGITAGYGQSILVLPSLQTARYARVDIADVSNPESLLRVALAYAGPVFEPARNFSPRATSFVRSPSFAIPVTRGGQEFPELRFSRRGWTVSLPLITATEAWSRFQECARLSEGGRNVLFIPAPTGTTAANIAREAVFGRLAQTGEIPWAQNSAVLRAWSFTITERL